MKLFEELADDIFARAGVDKASHMALWQNAVCILSAKMAWLSAFMGLSYERVDIFNNQKETLVQDLLDLKASGGLEAAEQEMAEP